MDSIEITKVSIWFATFCLYIVIYLSFSLEDYTTICEEYNSKENRHNGKLQSIIQSQSYLTSLEKVLSADVMIGRTSMKLKNNKIPTETLPISIYEFNPSSVAISCFEKYPPAQNKNTAPIYKTSYNHSLCYVYLTKKNTEAEMTRILARKSPVKRATSLQHLAQETIFTYYFLINIILK